MTAREEFLNSHHLDLNALKTEFVTFCKRNDIRACETGYIRACETGYECKYLGLKLDKNLTLQIQVKTI